MKRKAPLLSAAFVFSLCSFPAASFHVPVPSTYTTSSRRLSPAVKMDQEEETEEGNLFASDSTSATLNATSVSNALFSDDTDANSSRFGDVVRPKYLSTEQKESTTNLFTNEPVPASSSSSSSSSSSIDEVEVAANMRRRNVVVAIASVAAALLNYLWQFTHPVSPVQLLVGMQESSSPVSVIGVNGKPTVVDFWAPVSVSC